MSGTHLGLVAAAKRAIDAVFADRSTDQETVLVSLEELQELVMEKIADLEMVDEEEFANDDDE
jgi:hypothetical protein